MPNYVTMPKQQQILALLTLGWSYRRIEAETGVRRETISRYDRRRANAAKTFPGSDRPPPQDSLDPDAPDEAKAAKTFAGSGSKAAKTFAGSVARPRFTTIAALQTLVTANLPLFDHGQVKTTFKVDVQFVSLDNPPGVIVDHTRFWFGLFSHRRTGLWKGLLQIPLAVSADDTAAAALVTP